MFEFSVFEKLSLLCRPGVLNLLVLTYPQLRIVPLWVPPNQNCNPFAYPQIKNSTQINLFWVGFKIWRTPCELLAYPEGYAYPRLRTADVDYCSQQRMDSWKAGRWRDELVLSLFFGIVSKFIYLLFTTDLYTYPCDHDTFKQLAITLEKIWILFYLSFPDNWNQTFLFGKLKSTRYLWLLNNIQIIFNNA